MTLHLIDANVLMTAHNTYYGIDAVPEFWAWLTHQANNNNLKIPMECYEEILDGSNEKGRDLLYDWVRTEEIKKAILFDEQVDAVLAQQVVELGYAGNLTDIELEQIGQDPFLIAHALKSIDQRVVVTTEVSKPTKKRQNRHIPDVCGTFGITCIDPFKMYKALGFSTRWAI